MSTLFIADLHLSEERPDITEAFLSFLKQKAMTCDALYILGDFFDIWVGDDAMGDFERMIAQQLRYVSEQGVDVYLMHGNRDFAIGNVFCRLAGCKLIKDPTKIQLYSQDMLLSHGDILCTRDVDYQKKRRFYRNPFVLFILSHILPLRKRLQIAQRLRKESQSKRKMKSLDIMDVTLDAVPPFLKKYGTQLLIHGHTHRPATHSLEVDGKPAQRIVLGDWEPNGKVLKITPKGFFLENAI